MISAQVLDDMELDSENGAIPLGGHFVVIDVPAAVDGAEEILAARLDPFHRLVDFHRHEAHQRLLGVDVEFAAESAADLRSHDAQSILFKAQHLRHQRSHEMRNLR